MSRKYLLIEGALYEFTEKEYRNLLMDKMLGKEVEPKGKFIAAAPKEFVDLTPNQAEEELIEMNRKIAELPF